MSIHLRTLLTLGTLVVLVLLGVTWGWAALTSPFPHNRAQPVCVTSTLQPGDHVSAPKVTVSVYNASQRVGLAEQTMTEFEDQGFGPGTVGNAPKGTVVPFAQVWASDPTSPAVRLVASRLGPSAHVVRKTHGGPGIVVMVGPLFGHLVNGLQSVKVTTPTRVCEPPTT